MAALVAAIHVFGWASKDVEGRHEATRVRFVQLLSRGCADAASNGPCPLRLRIFLTRRKIEATEDTEFFALTQLASNRPSKLPHRSTRASREELRVLGGLDLPPC
jgi:hypothetical protein